MNPDIKKMREELDSVLAWKKARETIQLSYPVDDTSRINLRAVTSSGQGSHALTQNVGIGGVPTTIVVPAAFTGTIIFETADGRVEIPYF